MALYTDQRKRMEESEIQEVCCKTVPSRCDSKVSPLKSQQHGCLNKTCTMAMPMWKEEINLMEHHHQMDQYRQLMPIERRSIRLSQNKSHNWLPNTKKLLKHTHIRKISGFCSLNLYIHKCTHVQSYIHTNNQRKRGHELERQWGVDMEGLEAREKKGKVI